VGGSNSNYLYWDGATFAIDGNITARQGTFSGNVSIASGGSLYSGNLTPQGALSGAGYILNNLGLTFNSATTSGITTIDAATGLFTTSSANIGQWNVNSSSISKTSNQGTITLDSSTAQIRASSANYTAGIAAPDLNNEADIVIWAGGPRSTASNFYVQANGTVVMKSAIITGYASANDVLGLAKTDMSNVTTIDGGKITTGQIKSSNHTVGTVSQLPFSGSGTLIDLTNGSIITPQFYVGSDGTAQFKGTLYAGISISSPNITGGTLQGATVTVSDSFTSSGLTTASDSGLGDDDSTSGGTQVTVGNQTFSPTLTLSNGKISSTSILKLEGQSYTEILSGGTQSAIFDSTKSSLIFSTGLYLGNPNTSSSSSIQGHSTPYITIDARMRLRRGAPLTYPSGSTGAYVRNIYIKNTTSNPSPTTGYVGDIMITY
jgi:hypothetical protein